VAARLAALEGQAAAAVQALVHQHRGLIAAVAETLIERETLIGGEIDALLVGVQQDSLGRGSAPHRPCLPP
jgi:hypothetical protein